MNLQPIRLNQSSFCHTLALVAAGAAVAASGQTLTLKDHLNRDWRNELVTFSVSANQRKAAEAGQALVDRQGQPTLYQLTADETGTPRITLLANVDAFDSQTYRFDPAAKKATTDLLVEQTADLIRVTNSRTGIAIARQLEEAAGPIQAVRLASGKWVGKSSLVDAPAVVSHEAHVVEKGDAYVQVVSQTTFAGGGEWRIVYRIQANEPVVHIHETFELDDKSRWIFDLNEGFSPDHLYYRYGMAAAGDRAGALHTWALNKKDNDILFLWEPWLHWWVRMRQGTWFGLYNSQENDVLALAACEPSRWVKPQVKNQNQVRSDVLVTQTASGPQADFSLASGERVWILAALDKDASLEPIREKEGTLTAPLPQQLQIKHGDFPLERVKNYVLEWKANDKDYPRLYFTRKDVAELRRQSPPKVKEQKAQKPQREVLPHEIPQAAYHYLLTGDEWLGQEIARHALEQMQAAVDIFVRQEVEYSLGFSPHHRRQVVAGISLADLVLATPHLTDEQRQRLKAQTAFLGYTTARPDFWSPVRGFGANPNMTSTVMSFQVAAGSLIPDHPHARQWVEAGLQECDNQLDHWTDTNGGCLEAPHYSMATYNYLLGCYLMAYNAGFSDRLYDEQIKKIALMFARISTPPDPRVLGLRHLPPIGNTYLHEPTGQFATVAYLWREKDPEFSAQMRWMFDQHGRQPEPGVGGAYATLEMARRTFNNFDGLSAQPPSFQSELFPEQGVVLHSHFPSDRETQLYLISGKLHDHYDYDSGSITFWGKGSPLIDDFGYHGRAPWKEHSLFTASTASANATMRTVAFTTSETLDYVRGDRLAATRQIAFVKDQNPLGMNYVVMRDSLAEDQQADADWRVWLDADSVKTRDNGALAVGKFDVDLDIHFAAPGTLALETETITRSVFGLNEKGKYSKLAPSRIGLIAAVPQGSDVFTVLFPRLKTDPPPRITSLDEGRVVKVQFGDTTDYVFLNQSPFDSHVEGIQFSGTVGLARVRNGKTSLVRGDAGRAHNDDGAKK